MNPKGNLTIRLKAKARRSSIRLRTLSLSSASASSAASAAFKLLLERGLSKLQAGRAKKFLKKTLLHNLQQQ